MSDYVSVTRDDRVATLTIDRADRHNSLVPPLLEAIRDAIETLADESEIHVIRLETAGSTFSTGGDVAAFYKHRDNSVEYAERTVGLLNDVILSLLEAPQILIAVVDGQVTGGSLGLVLASDIVLVNENVNITPYYPVVGFSPDGGWTALLPDVIGRTRATFVLAANRTITPEDAVEWGLATELVTGQSVRSRAETLAQEVSSMKTGSVQEMKRLSTPDIDEVSAKLAAEREAFVEQIQTEEAVNGMREFLSQ